MPARNVLKLYVENGYYHIYNRGIDKREIFLDDSDCAVFLHYVKMYLSPKEELQQLALTQPRINRFLYRNLSSEIDLLSFTLMPNHIHLLVKQYKRDSMIKLMRRVMSGYVGYFNKKYKRVGALFQSRYKAALIESENYLLHLSRYIHLNSRELQSIINFQEYSSYPYYLGKREASWVKPSEILSFFRSARNLRQKDMLSYESFVEDYREDPREILGELTLEN